MTIIVSDKGGLGNILFQIAAAFSLALKTGHSFAVLRKTRAADERPDTFDCMIRSVEPSDGYPFQLIELGDIEKNGQTMTICEPTFRFSPIEIPKDAAASDVIVLSGYFQSSKYFAAEFEEFYAAIRFSVIRDSVHQETAHMFPKPMLVKAASLHFRLGDYKNLPDHHPILPYEYYRNAIQRVIIEGPIENILYFHETEDAAHAEAFIARLSSDFPEILFSRAGAGLDDWKQMVLMSLCAHNIIANSSFSWWSAFLNRNPEKVICFPDVWFGPAMPLDIADLCPAAWRCIACR